MDNKEVSQVKPKSDLAIITLLYTVMMHNIITYKISHIPFTMFRNTTAHFTDD